MMVTEGLVKLQKEGAGGEIGDNGGNDGGSAGGGGGGGGGGSHGSAGPDTMSGEVTGVNEEHDAATRPSVRQLGGARTEMRLWYKRNL